MGGIGFLAFFASLLTGTLLADGLLVNPGFDFPSGGDGSVPGWGRIPTPYRLAPREGMNGTQALYFECAEGAEHPKLLQEIKVRPGHRYVHHAMIKIDGFKPHNERGATLGFFYYDKDGKLIGSYAHDGKRNAKLFGQWGKYGGITRPVPLGTVRACFGPFVYGGCTGKVWYDDIVVEELEEKPVDLLYSSAYRNLAAEGPVTFVATLNVLTNEHPLATLEATFAWRGADGTKRRCAAETLATDQARVTLDVADLAMGANLVGFELREKGGDKPLGRTALTFTRVKEEPDRPVAIDRYGRTLVRGRPYFPLGGFTGKITEAVAKEYAASPFNCVMSYDLTTPDELDLLQRHGLMNICCLADAYADGKRLKTVEDEEAVVRKRVAALKDHPGVLAWYVNDERPATMRNQLIRRQKLLEELDAGHPTWAVLYQIGDMRSYLPTADVIGSDPYPVPMYGMESAYAYVKATAEGTCGLRGIWQVPQIFDWAVYGGSYVEKSKAPPTLFQMRSMAWQAIVGGANGLVFFSFGRLRTPVNGHTFEDRWRDVCAMGEEIKRYVPAMLSVEPAPRATSGDAKVPTRVWSKDCRTYVLVVNAQGRPFKGAVTLSRPFAEVETAFGASAERRDARTLEVALRPHEPAMYILK